MTQASHFSCHMNITVPVRFEVELAPADWSMAEGIPQFWSKMPGKPIVLSAYVPLLNAGIMTSFVRFPLEHLKPRWRTGLTMLKRRELAKEGVAALDSGQDQPFEVFLCRPGASSKCVRSDPRELRDAFFALKETTDLLSFLNRSGMWRESYNPSGAGWCPKSISDLVESLVPKPLFGNREQQEPWP